MSFISIMLTLILERYNLLTPFRDIFDKYLNQYVNYFINKDFSSVRAIRLSFFIALIPVVIIFAILKALHYNHWLLFFVINTIIFMLCVNMLGWKAETNQTSTNQEFQPFVQTYATKFFATTFWFLVLPSASGALCYVVLDTIGNNLRIRGKESLVYSQVIDKMLFWLNILPYTILAVFIAIAGDFEEATHSIVEQIHKVRISFYQLKYILNDVILMAIGKDKFAKYNQSEIDEITSHNLGENIKFDPKITQYISALLYRAGIFFIIVIAIISLANAFN